MLQKEAIHFFCSALDTRNGNNNNEKWKVAQFLQQGWQSDAAEGYIPYIFIVPYASCGRLDVISVLRTRRRTIRKPLLEETQRLEWLSPPPKIRKKSSPPPATCSSTVLMTTLLAGDKQKQLLDSGCQFIFVPPWSPTLQARK